MTRLIRIAKPLTCAALLITMLLTMLLPAMATAPATGDERSNEQIAAETLYGLNLFLGYGQDEQGEPVFGLSDSSTRLQGVIMVLRLLGLYEDALESGYGCHFNDVFGEHDRAVVSYAIRRGFTIGISPEKYDPSGKLSAAMYLTFILRLIGYQDGVDFEWNSAWELSDEIGISFGQFNKGENSLSRGDMAIISLMTLSANIKGTEQTLVEALEKASLVPEGAAATVSLAIGSIDKATATKWEFPTMYITTPLSPFIDKETWQDGTITLAGAKEEFTFNEVGARIRGRGNSTWTDGPDKRPLRFRFSEARPMMGSEYAAKDWILLANHLDRSLLRNYGVFYLANLMCTMSYAPSANYLHLYVNGEYMGVYLLTDERDVNPGRMKLTSDPDPEKCGYFMELDGRAPQGGVENVDYVTADTLTYGFKYPGSPDLTPEHIAYAKSYLEDVGSAIRSKDFGRITEMIDLESFVDFYLVQELVKNSDVTFFSVFISISGEGDERKLYMGPLWDFDIAAGNKKDQTLGSGPEHLYVAVYNYWYRYLMGTPEFVEAVTARWNEIKDAEIAQTISEIRGIAVRYQKEFERNFIRHQVMGTDALSIPAEVVNITSFMGQADYLVNWLEKRAQWMDDYFNGRLAGYDHMWALVDFYTNERRITIVVDDMEQGFGIQPVMLQNTVMVPLDELGKMFGIATNFDPKTGTVELSKGELLITHIVGSLTCAINGVETNMGAPSVLIREHPFIPLRVVAQALGYSVGWQTDALTVTIS